MKAIVYEGPYRWEQRDVPDPVPGPGEVRLAVAASGVCGTDVHLHAGEFGPVYPLTPGHEITGYVDAVGEGVTLPLGELVALDNMMACGGCVQCRRSRPQFCASMRALGITDPGGFAGMVVAPAAKCHVATDLGPDVAVFTEPVACVVHGLDVLALRPGSDVLVLGTGPAGLLLAQLLAGVGAARVTVAGRSPAKLEIAAGHGADETVRLDPADPARDDETFRSLAPEGFDVVVDATGAVDVLSRCLAWTGIGGTVFVYGMTAEAAELTVSPYDIFRRELRVLGSFSQAFSFDRAMTLLRSGRVRTDGLITHRFRLPDYGDAIAAVADDSSCLKAVLAP